MVVLNMSPFSRLREQFGIIWFFIFYIYLSAILVIHSVVFILPDHSFLAPFLTKGCISFHLGPFALAIKQQNTDLYG